MQSYDMVVCALVSRKSFAYDSYESFQLRVENVNIFASQSVYPSLFNAIFQLVFSPIIMSGGSV